MRGGPGRVKERAADGPGGIIIAVVEHTLSQPGTKIDESGTKIDESWTKIDASRVKIEILGPKMARLAYWRGMEGLVTVY